MCVYFVFSHSLQFRLSFTVSISFMWNLIIYSSIMLTAQKMKEWDKQKRRLWIEYGKKCRKIDTITKKRQKQLSNIHQYSISSYLYPNYSFSSDVHTAHMFLICEKSHEKTQAGKRKNYKKEKHTTISYSFWFVRLISFCLLIVIVVVPCKLWWLWTILHFVGFFPSFFWQTRNTIVRMRINV